MTNRLKFASDVLVAARQDDDSKFLQRILLK